MEHAGIVGGGETRADLAGDLGCLITRQPSDPSQEQGQILTIDKFHREKMQPFRLADVVNPADVRMRNLTGDPHLILKPGENRSIESYRFGEKLESDDLLQLEILRLINLAHPAAPEKADDPIAVAEHCARDESRPICRFGGMYRGFILLRRQKRRRTGSFDKRHCAVGTFERIG